VERIVNTSTIVVFMVYFAATSLLQFWINIPYSLRAHEQEILDLVTDINDENIYNALLYSENRKELAENFHNAINERVRKTVETEDAKKEIL